jgi:hypothetical protein
MLVEAQSTTSDQRPGRSSDPRTPPSSTRVTCTTVAPVAGVAMLRN